MKLLKYFTLIFFTLSIFTNKSEQYLANHTSNPLIVEYWNDNNLKTYKKALLERKHLHTETC